MLLALAGVLLGVLGVPGALVCALAALGVVGATAWQRMRHARRTPEQVLDALAASALTPFLRLLAFAWRHPFQGVVLGARPLSESQQ